MAYQPMADIKQAPMPNMAGSDIQNSINVAYQAVTNELKTADRAKGLLDNITQKAYDNHIARATGVDAADSGAFDKYKSHLENVRFAVDVGAPIYKTERSAIHKVARGVGKFFTPVFFAHEYVNPKYQAQEIDRVAATLDSISENNVIEGSAMAKHLEQHGVNSYFGKKTAVKLANELGYSVEGAVKNTDDILWNAGPLRVYRGSGDSKAMKFATGLAKTMTPQTGEGKAAYAAIITGVMATGIGHATSWLYGASNAAQEFRGHGIGTDKSIDTGSGFVTGALGTLGVGAAIATGDLASAAGLFSLGRSSTAVAYGANKIASANSESYRKSTFGTMTGALSGAALSAGLLTTAGFMGYNLINPTEVHAGEAPLAKVDPLSSSPAGKVADGVSANAVPPNFTSAKAADGLDAYAVPPNFASAKAADGLDAKAVPPVFRESAGTDSHAPGSDTLPPTYKSISQVQDNSGFITPLLKFQGLQDNVTATPKLFENGSIHFASGAEITGEHIAYDNGIVNIIKSLENQGFEPDKVLNQGFQNPITLNLMDNAGNKTEATIGNFLYDSQAPSSHGVSVVGMTNPLLKIEGLNDNTTKQDFLYNHSTVRVGEIPVPGQHGQAVNVTSSVSADNLVRTGDSIDIVKSLEKAGYDPDRVLRTGRVNDISLDIKDQAGNGTLIVQYNFDYGKMAPQITGISATDDLKIDFKASDATSRQVVIDNAEPTDVSNQKALVNGGTYLVTAKATDSSGNTISSPRTVVHVGDDNLWNQSHNSWKNIAPYSGKVDTTILEQSEVARLNGLESALNSHGGSTKASLSMSNDGTYFMRINNIAREMGQTMLDPSSNPKQETHLWARIYGDFDGDGKRENMYHKITPTELEKGVLAWNDEAAKGFDWAHSKWGAGFALATDHDGDAATDPKMLKWISSVTNKTYDPKNVIFPGSDAKPVQAVVHTAPVVEPAHTETSTAHTAVIDLKSRYSIGSSPGWNPVDHVKTDLIISDHDYASNGKANEAIKANLYSYPGKMGTVSDQDRMAVIMTERGDTGNFYIGPSEAQRIGFSSNVDGNIRDSVLGISPNGQMLVTYHDLNIDPKNLPNGLMDVVSDVAGRPGKTIGRLVDTNIFGTVPTAHTAQVGITNDLFNNPRNIANALNVNPESVSNYLDWTSRGLSSIDSNYFGNVNGNEDNPLMNTGSEWAPQISRWAGNQTPQMHATTDYNSFETAMWRVLDGMRITDKTNVFDKSLLGDGKIDINGHKVDILPEVVKASEMEVMSALNGWDSNALRNNLASVIQHGQTDIGAYRMEAALNAFNNGAIEQPRQTAPESKDWTTDRWYSEER
ncbi:hypothetical protein K9M79_01300 [Candidatus Woesearchaeota archaeon]|nr:hypothetical protein [Candidatus Woesearchaeota archaeon]